MKTRFPRADAIAVAKELCNHLKSVCVSDYLVVAGSLRRGAQEVGDVEILFVPLSADGVRSDMFSPPPKVNLADMVINQLCSAEILKHRRTVDGTRDAGWGPKNKLAVHVASGIPADLFATTEANWFVSLVIRTGPKDLNLKLTTGALRRGYTLNAYGAGITDSGGQVTPATSERHVFELCGVPYAEPKDRR
jgi:DNA polymerase/3'-5' exonuclease PolX